MRRLHERVAYGLAAMTLAVAAAMAVPPQSSKPPPRPAGAVAAWLSTHRTVGPATPDGTRGTVGWHGGPIGTAGGAVVDVWVSDAYQGEPNTPQRWADFFATLPHGDEISSLHVLVAPLDGVEEMCGADALGCYAGDLMVLPGELDPASGVTPDEVARHEYGHHVALHRANPPWRTTAWGTKRWATAMHVCERAEAGTVAPGDEGDSYALNPGEGFAEGFRILAERQAGLASFTWGLVDSSLAPDEPALAALEQDVLRPWTPKRPMVLGAQFLDGRTTVRQWTIALPLDGLLEVSAAFPLGSPYRLVLRSADGATVLAEGQWAGPRSQTLAWLVCGAREALVQVVRSGDPGFVTVRVSAP